MSTNNDIYDDGDLTLIVGENETHFRVSKVALCLASPVWRAMVSGEFVESTTKEVRLPTDQADAMRVLLLQAHLQFARLPSRPSFKTVSGIAELCEKYDVLSLTQDRLIEWVARFRVLQRLPPSSQGDLVTWARGWIWIGWTLKRWDYFCNAMEVLMQKASPVALSRLGDLPPGCEEFLIGKVKATMQAIIDIIYDEYEATATASVHGCEAYPDTINGKLCLASRLGLATRFMIQFDFPLTIDDKICPSSVKSSLKEMELHFQAAHIFDPNLKSTNAVYVSPQIHHCFVDWFRLQDCFHTFATTLRDDIKTAFIAHF